MSNPAIKLRPWQESDLPTLLRLRNDVELQALLLSTVRGSDINDVRAWLEKRTGPKDATFHIIADRTSNEPLGYIQAEGCVDNPSTWQLGICLDWPFQGAGRGTAVLREFHDLLGQTGSVESLRLVVAEKNIRALACYERLGYRPCDREADPVEVNGERKDVRHMVLQLSFGAARNECASS